MVVSSRRVSLLALAVSLLVATLVGCTAGIVPTVVKIGLVAPFEGRYREIGCDVIPAVRLALLEWMGNNPDENFIIELVAYDDLGDPDIAIEQARKLVADPEVKVVIGHWRDITTGAALPIYVEAGIPLITYSTDEVDNEAGIWNLSPSQAQLTQAVGRWAEEANFPLVALMNSQPTIQLDVNQLLTARSGAYATSTIVVGGPAWDISQFPLMAPERVQDSILFASGLGVPGESIDLAATDGDAFIHAYQEGSLGADPGPWAITAFRAGQQALRIATGQMENRDMNDANLSLTFGENGRRLNAPIYLYQWTAGSRQLEDVLVP